MSYTGKKVVILGLARQGMALAKYLAKAGAKVTVSDTRPAEALAPAIEQLADLTIEYALGGHPSSLLDRADLLCLSGGVSADLPIVREAHSRGIAVSNDSQIFMEVTPARVIGITGSAGKTTTTTLVGRMMALTPRPLLPLGEGGRVWVGGNIGNPLIADVDEMGPGDLAVMELSSFQLEVMTLSPQIGAVLNITPNHLDRHGTMEAYTAAKANVLTHQTPGDTAVLGLDDPGAFALSPLVRGRRMYFSSARRPGEAGAGVNWEEGAFLRGPSVMLRLAGRERAVCATSEIRLLGAHNVSNVLAACAIAGAAGAEPEAMRQAIGGFTGVAHRLEFVREVRGAKWYNDSIATAPERSIAAIRAFDEPLVLMAGGRDKNLPWGELADLVRDRVDHLVLFGEAGGMIREVIGSVKPGERPFSIAIAPRLAEAVEEAARASGPGDVVLLSPGGTSFDEFADFAERGEAFKRLVKDL